MWKRIVDYKVLTPIKEEGAIKAKMIFQSPCNGISNISTILANPEKDLIYIIQIRNKYGFKKKSMVFYGDSIYVNDGKGFKLRSSDHEDYDTILNLIKPCTKSKSLYEKTLNKVQSVFIERVASLENEDDCPSAC